MNTCQFLNVQLQCVWSKFKLEIFPSVSEVSAAHSEVIRALYFSVIHLWGPLETWRGSWGGGGRVAHVENHLANSFI
jgi:hypothetical protein